MNHIEDPVVPSTLSPEPDEPAPYEAIRFRGRVYLRGRLSLLAFLKLQWVQLRIRDAESRDDLRAALGDAAAFLRQHLKPVGRLRRALWPLTPNPFLLATPYEIGFLLGIVLRGAQVSSASRFSKGKIHG